ncbi:MAG: hypothetical protein R3A51_02335 [Nannocystaceae bacterium]|nr:hypothetical protein [Myxococcales bacterium]
MALSSRLLPPTWTAALAFSLGVFLACGDSDETCQLGAEGCDCTDGGGCDPGLSCLSGKCVDPGGTTAGPSTGDSDSDGSTSDGETTAGTDSGSDGTTTIEPTTDPSTTIEPTTDPSTTVEPTTDPSETDPSETDTDSSTTDPFCIPEGCKAIDLLFALDGSGSMATEINALSAAQAFASVVSLIEDINCGDIDYRIGVTDDNDGGFFTPNNWNGPNPWFDSMDMTPDEIAQAFQGAAAGVLSFFSTPTGCEHVLTSANALLTTDNTGFLRDEALLVVVLITDVDDYGAYDQQGGNMCGIGCNKAGPPVSSIYNNLVSLKGGDPAGVAAIVIAGDPSVNGGVNFCGQPGTCCGGFDCDVFHADRLWDFSAMQAGQNGFTANLCDGPQSVPSSVEAALNGSIDLACQAFEPPQ